MKPSQSNALPPEITLDRMARDLGSASPPRWYVPLKGIIDIVAATTMLALFLPLILLLMVLVKWTSPGPALYSQVRLGRNGRAFTLYKLRTMGHECERHTGPQWAALKNDPRVTRLGQFLRKSHLDELPQLWNVIRGEMSLVGPRPERPVFVEQLEQAIPDYGHRLQVRPGVTGLAQVQLPADTDVDSVRRKLVCDLYYIHTMNPLLDCQILMATATKVFGVSCDSACSVLGIPSQAMIESARAALRAQAELELGCLGDPA